jgi:nitrogen regulatory protein PII-like uncharacterized protein
MTKAEEVGRTDLSTASDIELRSLKNLADFERRGVVIGDRVFEMLLPKVEQEIARRLAG